MRDDIATFEVIMCSIVQTKKDADFAERSAIHAHGELNAILANKTGKRKATKDAEYTFLSITTTAKYDDLKKMTFANMDDRKQCQTDLAANAYSAPALPRYR